MPRRPLATFDPAAVLILGLMAWSAPPFQLASAADLSAPSFQTGVSGVRDSPTGSMLVDQYDAYLRDHDVEAFRRNVAARYNEGTLSRLLESPEVANRRASALALGLLGGYGCNATLAKALRDTDPTVRRLADHALWAVWFRADSPENNETLEKIQDLIGARRLPEAVKLADALIARAPTFAEAHNQRAIARFLQGQLAESVEDCRSVVRLNPFHTGALSGMGQCQLGLGRPADALKAFRQALEIQPYNEGLREVVAGLEANLGG